MMILTGDACKKAREVAGIDQLDVACNAGVALSTVRRLEVKGNSHMRVRTLRKIERSFFRYGIEFVGDGRTVEVVRKK